MPEAVETALLRLTAAWPRAAEARERLASLPPAADALAWLAAAGEALRDLADDTTRTASAASFWHTLWDGGLARAAARVPANIDPAPYPTAARDGLEHGYLLAASDADVAVVWPQGGRFAVYHAHPEGWWCVARDLATWIDDLAAASTTGPEVFAARIRDYTAASGATTFRFVTATGSALAAARAGEEVDSLQERLAAWARTRPDWRLQVSVRTQEKRAGSSVHAWQAVFDGRGADLDPRALGDRLTGRFRVLAHPQPQHDDSALSVEEGLRAERLEDKSVTLAGVRRRGGAVVIAPSSTEGRGDASSLRLDSPLAGPEVRQRLEALVRASGARRFTVARSRAGVERGREQGVPGRKLPRLATVLARQLGDGEQILVSPEGLQQAASPAAPLWL